MQKKAKKMAVPETRLTISVDTKLIVALQVEMMTKEKRSISKAEVIRIALQRLADNIS